MLQDIWSCLKLIVGANELACIGDVTCLDGDTIYLQLIGAELPREVRS